MALTTVNIGNWYHISGTPTEVITALSGITKEKVVGITLVSGVMTATYALN